MAIRKILPPSVGEDDDLQPYSNQALPITYKIGQYIRQSSDKQVKKNKQSTALQDEDLRRKLIRLGWKPEDIIKFDNDQGKSGQKRIDQRIDLSKLYRMIETGEIKAVATYDPSRLFRDLTRIQSDTFLDLCARYNVVVITYHRVYWPANRQDNKALHDEFEKAADFIDEVVYGKLIPAKQRAIYEDKTYGGHAVPVGYIIDYAEKSETYKCYIPYEPHAELVRFLFRRFRELNGKLHELGRELRRTNFQFPLFTGIDHVPHVALRRVGDGYPLVNRYGLISLLTNPAYIGRYLYNGRTVSIDKHEAIVDLDDFMYAYNRLSGVSLDGEPQDRVGTRPTRYTQTDIEPLNALLRDVIRSGVLRVYVKTCAKAYTARNIQDSYDKSDDLIVPIADIDSVYVDLMLHVLAERQAQEEAGENTMQDGLFQRLHQLQQEKEQEVVSVDKQLERVEKDIEKYERFKRIAEEEDSEQDYRDAVRHLKRLRTLQTELEAKVDAAEEAENEVAERETLLESVMNDWKSLTFRKKRRFVNLITEYVDVTEASHHFLRIEVRFAQPIGSTVVGYLWRKYGGHEVWSKEDEQLIETLFPYTDRAEILRRLPGRTWQSISRLACLKHISRYTRKNTSGIPEWMSMNDLAIMQALDMTPTAKIAHNFVQWSTPTENKYDSSS